MIAVAGCAQGLVIQAWLADDLSQLLGKAVHRLQGIRGCRNLKAGRLPEFLKSAIKQRGHFSTHQVARALPPSHGNVRKLLIRTRGLPCGGQDRPGAIFAHQKLVCDPGHGLNIKT